MQNNLHISLTDFQHETRVLKEIRSLLSNHMFNNVFIAALHSEGLQDNKLIDERIYLKRFKLFSRRYNKMFFVQMFKYLEFMIKIAYFYRKNNVCMVNVHHVFLLPLGFLLRFFYKAKLVYDTHELETETTGSNNLRKKVGKIIEKLLIKKADAVFVVSESIADWYKSKYRIDRPTVILNAPVLVTLEKNNYFRDAFNIGKDSLIFLYQGGLAFGRGLDLILETVLTRPDRKAVMVFMGYGELEEKIRASAKSSENVYFHSAVEPDKVLNYTSSADIGIVFTENTCLSHYYSMPNKLFEYAMASLPVIASNMKEISTIVKKYNMGYVVDHESVEGFKKAIEYFLNIDITELRNNARTAAVKNAWHIQEEKMIAVYRKIGFGEIR